MKSTDGEIMSEERKEMPADLRMALEKALAVYGEGVKEVFLFYLTDERHCTTVEEVEIALMEKLEQGASNIISRLHDELRKIREKGA